MDPSSISYFNIKGSVSGELGRFSGSVSVAQSLRH